jgi:hypothetical protein
MNSRILAACERLSCGAIEQAGCVSIRINTPRKNCDRERFLRYTASGYVQQFMYLHSGIKRLPRPIDLQQNKILRCCRIVKKDTRRHRDEGRKSYLPALFLEAPLSKLHLHLNSRFLLRLVRDSRSGLALSIQHNRRLLAYFVGRKTVWRPFE